MSATRSDDLPATCLTSPLGTVLALRALEEASVAVAVVAVEGWRHVWGNRAFRELAGGGEVAGQAPGELFPAAAGTIAALLEAVASSGRADHARALPLRLDRDGPTRHFDYDLIPLREPDGRVTAILATVREVTDEVRAREAGERARAERDAHEQRLRLALDAAGLAAWDVDVRTGAFSPSPRFAELHGFPPGRTPTSAELRARFHPDDVDRARAKDREAMDHPGRMVAYGYRYVLPDGHVRHLEVRGVCLADGDGEATRALGVTLDVTEAKLAEQALKESEARFRAIAEAVPGLTWITDAQGRNRYVSPSFCAYAGRPAEALLERGYLDLIHPDDLPRAWERWHAAVASGSLFEAETRLRRHDGVWRWHLTRCAPQRGPDGSIVQWVGIGTDIDDRIQAEQRRRDSEARLLLAQEAAGIGTWEFDPTTGRQHWSAEQFRLYGLPPGSPPTYAEWLELLHPEDRAAIAAAVQAIGTAGEREWRHEFRIRRPDTGEERWLLGLGRVVEHDAAGRATRLLGVDLDVTEAKRREAALAQALALRDLLLREVGHRVMNSLQMVSSILSMQERRLADPEARAALAATAARVRTLAGVYGSMRLSGPVGVVDLGTALGELCAQLGGLAPQVRITCEAPPGLAAPSDVAAPLCLVVNELATNAIKHAFGAGAEGRLTVTARPAPSGGLVLTVADDGIGMVPDDAPEGLGSLLVRGLVQQLRATLVTRSDPGRGTTVTLELPPA